MRVRGSDSSSRGPVRRTGKAEHVRARGNVGNIMHVWLSMQTPEGTPVASSGVAASSVESTEYLPCVPSGILPLRVCSQASGAELRAPADL